MTNYDTSDSLVEMSKTGQSVSSASGPTGAMNSNTLYQTASGTGVDYSDYDYPSAQSARRRQRMRQNNDNSFNMAGGGNRRNSGFIRGSFSGSKGGHKGGKGCSCKKNDDNGDDGTLGGLIGLLGVATLLLFTAITMNLGKRKKRSSPQSGDQNDQQPVDLLMDVVFSGEGDVRCIVQCWVR